MVWFWKKYGLLFSGVIIGVLYGFFTRLAFGDKASLASVTYLFMVPTILGMIPLMLADKDKIESYKNIIFIPWITVASFFLLIFLSGKEDGLCLLVLSLPFFLLGTIGGLIYRFIQINREKRKGKLYSIVLIPFLFAPIENYIKSPSAVYNVKSKVIITASRAKIWDNIVDVKTIKNEEYNFGLFNDLGIPKPISASVDRKVVGGKRIGHFEEGLTFYETITEFQENQKISFSIAVDPQTIRQSIFDQHVLNGNYFTFVDATYQLKEIGNGQVELSLSSSYQLTSKVNFYGKFWGDIILGDFQSRLLEVIEKRCKIVTNENYQ